MRRGALAPASDVVATRLARVRARIARAGGPAAGNDGSSVKVVAVTKGFGVEAVVAARLAGVADIGENYARELIAKRSGSGSAQGSVSWHFLGPVQRNKVARLAASVDLWQGVDRLPAGEEIAHRAPGAQVLVQVNISGLPGRPGCEFEDVPELVDRLSALGLDVRGLMAVGPLDPARARAGFRRLADLRSGLGLAECSMGMTDDLEAAVAEGSTMVRIGRGLFGPRPEPAQLRR